METKHVFYSLRMLYNHSVPKQFRIQGGRYTDPHLWSAGFKRRWVAIFIGELINRKPLPEWMLEQVQFMQCNAEAMGATHSEHDHILLNRKSMDEAVHEAAARGDPIAGMAVELEFQAGLANPFHRTMMDFRDEDEDDDIRPF